MEWASVLVLAGYHGALVSWLAGADRGSPRSCLALVVELWLQFGDWGVVGTSGNRQAHAVTFGCCFSPSWNHGSSGPHHPFGDVQLGACVACCAHSSGAGLGLSAHPSFNVCISARLILHRWPMKYRSGTALRMQRVVWRMYCQHLCYV